MLRRSSSVTVCIASRLLSQAPRRWCSAVDDADPPDGTLAEKERPTRRMFTSQEEMHEVLMHLRPDSPPDSRILRIGVIGRAGVGKSTLVNRLAQFQACATSAKVNTTRSKQNVVYTEGNTQLVFLDLPGIMSPAKFRRFNLCTSIMRDPYAGIHQSDIICVLADAADPHRRQALDKDVLKALHFFSDKPAVLVLTKADRLGRRRSLLLDMTRRLSGGVVGGTVSHRDRYAARQRRRGPAVDVQALLDRPETRALAEKHAAAGLAERSDDELLAELEAMGDGPAATQQQQQEERHGAAGLAELEAMGDGPAATQQQQQQEEEEPRALAPRPGATKAEVQTAIDDYFDSHPPLAAPRPPGLPAQAATDPVLALLREQMLLQVAPRAEVAARVRRWHALDEAVRGETAWPHFREAFMLSAVSGRGVARLRQYLLSQAKAGPWAYHSSLASDQDPHDTVCLAVRAQCLNLLRMNVPYDLHVVVSDYEVRDDGCVDAEVTVLCRTEFQVTSVLGPGGRTINAVVRAATRDVENALSTNVRLRVCVRRAGIPKAQLRKIMASGDFRNIFPGLGKSGK